MAYKDVVFVLSVLTLTPYDAVKHVFVHLLYVFLLLFQALSKMKEHSMKTNLASNAGGRRDHSGGQRDIADSEQGQQEEQGAVGGQPDMGSDGSMSDVAVRHIMLLL